MEISTAKNKILVRRFEEAMNKRQLDALDEVVAPNFVRHCQATPNLDVRSLEQFKDFLRQDVAVFPDNTQTFTQVIAEGDTVAVWATYEGTQRGQTGWPLLITALASKRSHFTWLASGFKAVRIRILSWTASRSQSSPGSCW